MWKKTTDIIFIVSLVFFIVYFGRGVPEAIKIHEVNSVIEKAEQGNADEQFRLAEFYRLGWWHVKKDDEKAIEWYQKAQRNGSRSSEAILCNEYKIGCENAENSQ